MVRSDPARALSGSGDVRLRARVVDPVGTGEGEVADERVLREGLWQAFRSHPSGGRLWREAESAAAFAARIVREAGEDPARATLAALGRDVAKLSWPSWAFERALLPDEDRRFLGGHVVESVRLLERAAGWGEEEAVLRAVGQHPSAGTGGATRRACVARRRRAWGGSWPCATRSRP